MQVFLASHDASVMADVAAELIRDGVDPDRVVVYSVNPDRTLSWPVRLVRYRSPGWAEAIGAVAGAVIGVVVGLPLLLLGVLWAASAVVLVLLLALGGAVFPQWLAVGADPALRPLEVRLNQGQLVLVADLVEGRIGEMERRIKARHPDVAVLGTEAEGTPPFP